MNNDTISVLYGDLVTLIGHTSSKSLKVIYCSYYAKLFLLFRDFVYLFLERGEGGREIERETSICEKHRSVASHTSPNQRLALNQGMCPDWESNQQPFNLPDDTQPAELHQSGPSFFPHSSIPIPFER